MPDRRSGHSASAGRRTTVDAELRRLLKEYHAADAEFTSTVPPMTEPLGLRDAPTPSIDETAAAEAANRLARAAEQLRAHWAMRSQ
jgi:hypothetical protein